MAQFTDQSVLVVDDAPDVHTLVGARLRSENLTLYHAYNGDEALRSASEHRPDLVLLDLDMPMQDGLAVCRRLKADPELLGIPVIFLTCTSDVEVKAQALELGAVDYVTKPFDGVELTARVRAALRTKRYQDLLAARAQLDAVTGIWNRTYFEDRLAGEVAAARRQGSAITLVLADIDHFKRVNDTHGHPFGDQVLHDTAAVFRQRLRKGDVVCRYGGEEFAFILRDTSAREAPAFAERLRQGLCALRLEADGRPVGITASFGLSSSEALGNRSDLSAELLVQRADEALYRAKREGRNRICAGTD